MRINVHIERLILEDLPVATSQAPGFQVAVEDELARLVAANGLSHEFRHGATVFQMYAGPVQIERETRPVKFGQSIARALYGAIGSAR
jgi:hypothetical protein